MTQEEKFTALKALHTRPGCFVIPNPWDAGSAKLLTQIGFPALATTSAGYAFSVGKRDSFAALSRDEILENARQIVEATHLPVSADLENGFGETPEACQETIRRASGVGLVGGSIEDATGWPDQPIFDFSTAVDRVAAAAETAKSLPFLLTARAENYLWGVHDLDDTIRRLQAFSAAGADVLYAPGLPDLEAIRTVCASVDKPVNVVAGLSGRNHTFAELADAGVKRISVGGSFARAALGALYRAATEVHTNGTFEYADDAIADRDIARLMSLDPQVAG